MDKTQYRLRIRQAVEAGLRGQSFPFIRRKRNVHSAIVGLTEQYTSISEEAGVARYTFDETILQQAYDACTYDGGSAPSFKTVFDRSSLGLDYASAFPHMQAVLGAVFAELRPG